MAAHAPQAAVAPTKWRIELADEAATAALAVEVAGFVKAGDLLTLSGDLGAGKTTFARALIRTLTGDPVLDVPSPTFTLMQIYDSTTFSVLHADFYRIQKPEELTELGWEEASEGALVIVEWPERGGLFLAGDRLDIGFSIDTTRGAEHRTAILSGFGNFAPRLVLAQAVHELLAGTEWASALRVPMQGDASTRAYERLLLPSGKTAVLMISPPRPDGPVLRAGKSYSALAHLAEDITAFVAIDKGLRSAGLSAPEILALDRKRGVAVLEDFGAEGVVDEAGPIFERYAEAVAVLAHLHGTQAPDELPVEDDVIYKIPPYDLEALSIEVELLLDWYAPHVAHTTLSAGTKATFLSLWRDALHDIVNALPTWSLRDYHSPNLMWLPQRGHFARIGLIDFQDCVLGHPAYDVVSLLQDARTTVPDATELRLLGLYTQLRQAGGERFDMTSFASAYAVLGAQRATKILGIFARLDKRDHKPGYLAHLPRIEKYLAKDLAHPLLSELRGWYQQHLPILLPRVATDAP